MTDPFPPDWRIVGVSVPGNRHAATAQGNQDAWLYRPVTGDVFLLAVADGAGSRARSAVGSRLAVEAAFTSACAVLPSPPPVAETDLEALAGRWADACRATFTQAIEAIAGPLSTSDNPWEGLALEDFATTLLAVLVCPPWYCYISIGDCFVVVYRQPGGPQLVVPPAIAGSRGVTTFLTSSDADTAMSAAVILEPHLTGLVLCTDGLIEATLDTARDADGALCYIAPAEFTGFFEAIAGRTAADLAAGFTSPEYAAASGDDMTMVLAVRG